MPPKGKVFGMTEEKTTAEKKIILFVSDTHDNHNIFCQRKENFINLYPLK